MGQPERIKLMRGLQAEWKTHVISYVTSTRQNFEVTMAMDAVRLIYDQLCLAKKEAKEP